VHQDIIVAFADCGKFHFFKLSKINAETIKAVQW